MGDNVPPSCSVLSSHQTLASSARSILSIMLLSLLSVAPRTSKLLPCLLSAGLYHRCGYELLGGFPLVAGSRGYAIVGVWTYFGGFSCLPSTGSRRPGFSSCPLQELCSAVAAQGALLILGMWIFPHQGWNPFPLHWQADS